MSILIIYVVRQKLHALRRIRKYLSLEKTKLLCNAFINSQFNYAPLVWMFCRKKQYLKIQKIHHKALKVVYNSNKIYDELLRHNNEVSIHQSHLRALFNIWSFQIFKQSKSRVYVVVHCLQKHNVQYKKKSFAEITYCSIDFVRQKFSVIQSMYTLEELAPIY